MSPFSATAVAHPNIALVKYWGKRDEVRILPYQSSLSVTLAPLSVRTTVEFGAPADEVELHGRRAQGEPRARVLAVIERVRTESRSPLGGARVTSVGDFPMSAGLASSAAAFAALALAARKAARLSTGVPEVSILAREGSGSACRSVQGGFCVWDRGAKDDGSDSFAEQIFPPSHWTDLRLLVAMVSSEEKEVKSRDGMRQTVETSPYYPAWIESAEADVASVRAAIESRDLERLGVLAERNAWRMHATALAADPPLCYLKPKTLELILRLGEERKRGLPAWFTLDAGPNPVILTNAAHSARAEEVARACGAAEVVLCTPGEDARLVASA